MERQLAYVILKRTEIESTEDRATLLQKRMDFSTLWKIGLSASLFADKRVIGPFWKCQQQQKQDQSYGVHFSSFSL